MSCWSAQSWSSAQLWLSQQHGSSAWFLWAVADWSAAVVDSSVDSSEGWSAGSSVDWLAGWSADWSEARSWWGVWSWSWSSGSCDEDAPGCRGSHTQALGSVGRRGRRAGAPV